MADEISRSYTPAELQARGLQILVLEVELVLEIGALQASYPELSPNDLSVFIVARENQSILISGDGPLRQLADSGKVEYHGTLWLLEELVTLDCISPLDAARSLRTMLSRKRWLPRAESEHLIKKWESGDQ